MSGVNRRYSRRIKTRFLTLHSSGRDEGDGFLTDISDSGALVEEGATQREGEFPINVSGGSLGVGYLVEATGLQKVLEVVLQLRGEAGKRQLSNVKIGLAQSWRGIPGVSGAVIILSKE